MLASEPGFSVQAPLSTTDFLSRSSSFGSTTTLALKAVASISESHLLHVEASEKFKDPTKLSSLAEKKLQRLARNRATASVSRYMSRYLAMHVLHLNLCP